MSSTVDLSELEGKWKEHGNMQTIELSNLQNGYSLDIIRYPTIVGMYRYEFGIRYGTETIGEYEIGSGSATAIDSSEIKKSDKFLNELDQANKSGNLLRFLSDKRILDSDAFLVDNTPMEMRGSEKCGPREEWVPSYRKEDGTYVRGFCRKKKEKKLWWNR